MRKLLIFTVAALFLCSCGGNSGGNNTTQFDNEIDTTVVPQVLVKPVVNVYIENSMGTAGYVKRGSDFWNAVYDFLQNGVGSSNYAESLNLYLINEKIQKQSSDVSLFLPTLENSCNGKNTNIAENLDSILTKTDSSCISVFISDCISDGDFSKKSQSASVYLQQQQSDIQKLIDKHLSNYPNTAISIYQLQSNFDGTYYNSSNKGVPFNGLRPYYIWIIGDVEQLRKLDSIYPKSSFKGNGIKNSLIFLPANNDCSYHSILLNSNNIGSFYDAGSSDTYIHEIKKVKLEKKDKIELPLSVAIAIDFSKIFADSEMFFNPDNYSAEKNFVVDTIMKYSEDLIDSFDKGMILKSSSTPTHIVRLKAPNTDKVFNTVSFALKLQNMPLYWAYNLSDSVGSSPTIDKTFGLSYIVDGVKDGYNQKYKNATFYKYQITIK